MPLAFSLWISFQGWSIEQSLFGGRFVGLQNYSDLFADPAFVSSIWRTFVYTATTVSAELGIGLAWRCCSISTFPSSACSAPC